MIAVKLPRTGYTGTEGTSPHSDGKVTEKMQEGGKKRSKVTQISTTKEERGGTNVWSESTPAVPLSIKMGRERCSVARRRKTLISAGNG